MSFLSLEMSYPNNGSQYYKRLNLSSLNINWFQVIDTINSMTIFFDD